MAIFVGLSVASLIFYVFFKAKVFRTYRPMERNWVNSKSKMWLGSFIFFYGLNVVFSIASTVSMVVGSVFVGFGLLYIFINFRQSRILRPLAAAELEEAK